MVKYKFVNLVISTLVVSSLLFGGTGSTFVSAQAKELQGFQREEQTLLSASSLPQQEQPPKRMTPEERQAAADRNRALGLLPGLAKPSLADDKTNKLGGRNVMRSMSTPSSSVTPHYFGPFANYANSPLPKGPITGFTIDNAGSGYSNTPTVNIYDAYGTGTGATAQAVIVGGAITQINVTDGGADYSAPLAVIDDASGSGALATPTIGARAGSLTGGIRKFVDRLPGLGVGGANDLGNYIPVGVPDKVTYGPAFVAADLTVNRVASDYYEIALVQYTQQLHSDLPLTTLRGYVQLETAQVSGAHVPLYYPDGSPINYPGTTTQVFAVDKPRYLGPTIVANKNTPVRIKFYNFLPTGQDGHLFIPVDTTIMGAGMGPDMAGMPEPDPQNPMCGMDPKPDYCYKENRATLHLHGGLVPWISDGTPHQWTTPVGETAAYPKGVSVQNVPDMDPPGDGSLTFYYNNAQSARLMFYHDHAYGITRLNVYAGEAAGYVITDKIETDLINGTNLSGSNVNPLEKKVLPDIGIPLVIQDKTFVDATTIAAQDPTWKWGTGPIVDGRRAPNTGDLWVSSVYMPIQNPNDLAGANAFGRWQYGPWFNPPTGNVANGPMLNPYYDPGCDSAVTWCEPEYQPSMPTPSMGMESFNDTAMVNGAVYPYLDVDPTTVRFRILNAANDRFVNLHMYVADSSVISSDGRTNTEVKMVPAVATPGFPALWSVDGRAGGVPDPAKRGPSWIQIGTEGGFLPAPVVIPPQPINWQYNPGLFNVGNVTDHSLLLGCAERADVLVDFSAYAGKTLIVYNDAPAAFPALDPRYDYYTGNPSQMDSGGAPTTQPGYGPNTRTIMQIRVRAVAQAPVFNLNMSDLQSVFAKTASKASVFEASHPDEPIIVPQAAYNSAYDANLPGDAPSQYVQIGDSSKTFTPLYSNMPVNIKFETKAMHDEMGAAYDTVFGRMNSMLGLDIPNANNINQNILLYGYASPPVDVFQNSMTPLGTLNDGTQIWKIMHNGVDTHPIHFHLFNVQLINRVGWDGLLLPPDPNELGWKETVRVNPLEDTIIAMRPVATTQPFDIPNSIRLIDPTMPEGATLEGGPQGMQTPGAVAITVLNHLVNYGWEYVWHCHILSHEEMDMMHAMAFAVSPKAPSDLTATGPVGNVLLTWTDNSVNETQFTLQRTFGGVTTNIPVISNSGPQTGGTITYTDTVGTANSYKVLATNVVGDTFEYITGAGAINFPTKTMNSEPSNTASNPGAGVAVTSIVRASANPTSAASVNFTVTFSGSGPGTPPVDTNFALTTTGTVAGTIGSISGSGTTYTVTVNMGTGDGTLRLDTTSSAPGGVFTVGEVYTVGNTSPSVSSIVPTAGFANPSNLTGVNFTVTFNKPVTGVDKTDFTVPTTGTYISNPVITKVTMVTTPPIVLGTTYTVTVGNYKTNSGTLGLNLIDNDSIMDGALNPLGGPGLVNGDFTGETYAIYNIPPTVISSVRAAAAPEKTNAGSVNFTVTFSGPVRGVDKNDFSLNPTVTGATIISVTPVTTPLPAATYTVLVNTGTGNGTLRLNVLDNNSIEDDYDNSLGGPGVQNYTSGQAYTIDKIPPTVSSIVRASSNPTSADSVSFTVTFSENVIDVDKNDFDLTVSSGISGASTSSVTPVSASVYTVTVNTGSGAGTIRLDVIDNNSIMDAASNLLGGVAIGDGSFYNGEIYIIVYQSFLPLIMR